MGEEFIEGLQELCVIYAKTKRFVLIAEQADPESRSNIAIFKEQRDALDHIMRGLAAHFGEDESGGPDYLRSQIEKARGHLYRAAYDALDGAGISSKIRIDDAMKNVSVDAIAAVYKDYYDRVSEIDEIDERIIEYRNSKDVRPNTPQHLEKYRTDVARLCELAKEITHKIPAFAEWERRNRKRMLKFIIGVPAALVILGCVLKFAGDYYLKTLPQTPPVISAPGGHVPPALPVPPLWRYVSAFRAPS